jgi:hypothetical protein
MQNLFMETRKGDTNKKTGPSSVSPVQIGFRFSVFKFITGIT